MITIERYRNAGKDQERTHIVMVMPASFHMAVYELMSPSQHQLREG